MDWGTILSNAAQSAVGPDAVYYALAAIGLNIHFGYTGLLNFGQAGFMAVGGYGLAAGVATFNLPFGVALLLGLGAAVVLAFILGAPTLRLRADYLAIATIASAEILRLVIGSVSLREYFGGRDGLQQFAGTFASWSPYSSDVDFGIFTVRPYSLWVMTVGWVLVAICCVIVWALMRSPWGRVLKSIREDEEAVRSLGKNVYAYKMQSLVLGGVFGALAGFMVALQQAAINPDNFSTDVTFFTYTILLLGGAARVLGPVVGSIIFWFLVTFAGNFFQQATVGDSPFIPSWIMSGIQAGLVQFILVGVALILLMVYRPQGIFGDRRELAIDGR